MKVVVTGAKGQLGRSIQDQSINFPNLQFLFTDIDELDLSDALAVENFINNEMPSFVINCAAYTAVDKAEKEPLEAARINREAISNLARCCKKIRCKLIHISTDYLFDGNKSTPYNEKDIVNPRSVYGVTKLEGETAIIRSEAKAMIVRTSWLYSAYGNNFVKTMLRLGRERNQIKVVSDQVGTPTSADDLAAFLLKIAQRSSENPEAFKPGIYHYSNEGVCSWYDFTMAIFEYSPSIQCKVIPIETSEYPTPAQRPAYSVLNKSKIKTVFEIEIPFWRDSLKKCLIKIESHENK